MASYQKPELTVSDHFGYPVLLERDPIRVARVPVAGTDDALILHPRYVPAKIEHEIVEVVGRRRGRTIDILLDRPVTLQGEQYGIMNVKGVGADADDDMVIHPELWYKEKEGTWVPKAQGDPFGRDWGALDSKRGNNEVAVNVLKSFGAQLTPYAFIADIPQAILEVIGNMGNKGSDYCQIKRYCKTNVRLNEHGFMTDPKKEEQIDPEYLGRLDGKMITLQMEAAQTGYFLDIQGQLKDNRFIDGIFTDATTYLVSDTYPNDPSPVFFVARLIADTAETMTPKMTERYVKNVSETTGIRPDLFLGHIEEEKPADAKASGLYHSIRRVFWEA